MIDRLKLSGKIVEAGYNRRGLAEKMGISANTLCDKINGKRPFNTDEIVHICEILGIIEDEEKCQIFLRKLS